MQFDPPPYRTDFREKTWNADGVVSWPWAKFFQAISTLLQKVLVQFVTTQTTNYTANPGDTVLVDTTGGARTITLPLSKPSANSEIRVIKISVDGNSVTVAAAGSETINGATTLVLAAQYDKTTLVPDGVSKWYIF